MDFMNYFKYISHFILFTLITTSTFLVGQKSNYNIELTKQDSIYSANLPILKVPEGYNKRIALPSELDNSILPFMRPAFNQQGYWNCGQCAGVAYNFTYEINLARGVIGDWIVNQYSQNFTYNFMNRAGDYGVSYFNSFEAIKACGNPNLEDYGGMYNVLGKGWKSSYSLYENAMRNRIVDVYAIDVSTPEGLETLKYWLLDHMNGSEYGGLANFYFGWGFSSNLPPESPDSGFQVVLESHPIATHAMTIVGFNDSVRYDVNGDGKFTNNIDLNEDGILDMKDWEIGAVKYINSTTYDDGIGYMMYRVLALESGHGGIWNQQVHVLKVDAEYIPTASVRVKLRHNSREKIKLIAGISTNLDDNYPQHTMDFPIFNFQGGDYYMQGLELDETYKDIELALDISPLFSYLEDGQEAKFFIQVVENDKDNTGKGEVLYYSLVMELDTLNEIVCQQVPVDITNNAITTLQLTNNNSFDKVKIITNDLAKVEAGIISEFQLEAQGGTEPYKWSIENQYNLNEVNNSFSEINQTKLEFENNYEASTSLQLPFDFPFYGDTLDSITVFIDGFIMFEDKPYPYPYFTGEESIIKTHKMIAPFISNLLLLEAKDDGVWIDSNSERIIIRWKASSEYSWGDEVNFSLTLRKDGGIETHYGSMKFPEEIHWASGVSEGDKTNYTLLNTNQNHEELTYSSFSYLKSNLIPEVLSITENGLVSIMINESINNYPFVVQVKDRNGIRDSKVFNQTASNFSVNFQINNNDKYVDYDEISSINMDIENTSNKNYNNVFIRLHSTDEFLTLSDSIIQVGNLDAGEYIEISEAATFSFSTDVPDRYNSTIECELITDNDMLRSKITTTVNAPEFRFLSKQILDGDDGVLYPGETSTIKLLIQNTGHAISSNAFSVLGSEYNKIYIDFERLELENLYPGDTISVSYIIAAKFAVPMGTLATLDLDIYLNNKLVNKMTTDIRLGHIPVLILDRDPDLTSGLQLRSMLDELGLQNTLTSTLNVDLNNYLSVFVCMGGLFSNYTLQEKDWVLLSDYLNSSGNMYMEGRTIWGSPQYPIINNMFNIRAEQPSYYYPLDTVIGVNDLYTKNMMFEVNDETPYINYFIHPKEGATTLLKTQTHDSSGVTIAYDEGSYKTIGSSLTINSFVDTDLISTKKNYLLSILDFFDLKKYIYVDITENFSPSLLDLEIYPNPASSSVTFSISNKLSSESFIQILDLNGMIIYEKHITDTRTTSSITIPWDGTHPNGRRASPGLYLIRYTSGEDAISKKLIIK